MSGNEFLKENFLILYLHERLILLDDSEIPTHSIEIGCVTCILMSITYLEELSEMRLMLFWIVWKIYCYYNVVNEIKIVKLYRIMVDFYGKMC